MPPTSGPDRRALREGTWWSGGDGSELYRVELPSSYLGLTIDEVRNRLRKDHRATLLAVSRGIESFIDPPADFRVAGDDDLLVVAESLGTLAPLRPDRAMALPGHPRAHTAGHDEPEPA